MPLYSAAARSRLAASICTCSRTCSPENSFRMASRIEGGTRHRSGGRLRRRRRQRRRHADRDRRPNCGLTNRLPAASMPLLRQMAPGRGNEARRGPESAASIAHASRGNPGQPLGLPGLGSSVSQRARWLLASGFCILSSSLLRRTSYAAVARQIPLLSGSRWRPGGGGCRRAARTGAARSSRGPAPDLLKIKTVGEVHISPDGKRIAYTVQSNSRTGRPTSQIWIWDRAAGTTARLGGERDSGTNLRWSPDSQSLAFTGRVDDESGLMVQRMDGSPAARRSGASSARTTRCRRRATSSRGRRAARAWRSSTACPGPKAPRRTATRWSSRATSSSRARRRA